MTQAPQIADDIPQPVLLLDLKTGALTWLNHSAQSWLGKSLKSLSGKTLGALFLSETDLVELYEKTRARQTPVQVHDLVIKPRGRDEEKCHVASFLHEGQIGFCIDPQGRQISNENVFGDGASALGRLLAHEIKNPLAGIQGAAQLIRDDVETEEALSLISLIESEISRIRRLADRMERLGDVSPGEFHDINIHEILQHARKVIQSGISPNVTFSENYDPSLPSMQGHEDSLTQAVMNLIKNAAEAVSVIEGSPEIRLETSFRASGSMPIEIRVIDNGEGIPEHIRDKIFHPFITGKPQGQGLGLALVSKVVTAHNGVVEVQSRPGETIFSILLPIRKDTPS